MKGMAMSNAHEESVIATQSWDRVTDKGRGSRSLNVTLSTQPYDDGSCEYIVRTTNKSITRCDDETRVITEETVESFDSKKQGVAHYNRKLNSLSHPRYEEVRITY